MTGFESTRIARLRDAIARHVDTGDVGGVAWLVARGGRVEVGTAGVLTRGEPDAVEQRSLFRISSMTKPVTAVAALVLVEEGRLRLQEPVDDLLPELADRRVLVDPAGPIDGPTVPAMRSVTVHDVMSFQLGYGMDFTMPWPQPLLDAMGELELGAGPPEPQGPVEPDEWIRRLGTLPLLRQPGERWLYNVGSDVLGVLIARASGQPFESFLRERVFEPLGMTDTGFVASDLGRLGSCYGSDPVTGERFVYDAPDGQWSKPPAFASGAAGLVSTVDDIGAFGQMLLEGGRLPDGSRVLSRASVELLVTDQTGAAPGVPGPSLDGSVGWGLGVGVTVRRTDYPTVGAYGWSGGLGSSWANDPNEGLVATILTTDAFAGPFPPPRVVQDFWTGAYSSLS